MVPYSSIDQYHLISKLKMTTVITPYKLTRAEISKLFLKEIRNTGNVEILKKYHTEHPRLHWSELCHEKTRDSIMHIACRLGHIDIILYIVANYDSLVIDAFNSQFKTPLHEAAQFGHVEIMEILLDNGANINAFKQGDWTPLMLACTKISEEDYVNYKGMLLCHKAVKLLLDRGAAVNQKNKDGWTALHLVAREGNLLVLELLLSYNIDIHHTTRNHRSALHIAALHNSAGIAQKLIDLKLDVNLKDSCGNTPLHEAILGGNLEICNMLVENQADIHARNKTDFTVLHLAASQGDIKVIDYVVSILKIDIDITTADGLTPMHCAARKKHMEAFKYFVKHGANGKLEDKFGRTPSHYLSF